MQSHLLTKKNLPAVVFANSNNDVVFREKCRFPVFIGLWIPTPDVNGNDVADFVANVVL